MFSPLEQFYARSANPFYRFSAINYDTYHTDFSNRINLLYNEKMAELEYRSTHFFVPNMNYGVITPYSYNTNPFADIYDVAMRMFHNQSLQSGGPGLLDANGNLNLARQLFGAGVMGNMTGYMPGMVNPSVNPSVNPPKDPEGNPPVSEADKRKQERQIKAMTDLLTVYKEKYSSSLNQDEKDSIDIALKAKGTNEEIIETLTDEIKKYDANNMRKIIPLINDFRAQLVVAGYDFEDGNSAYHSTANKQSVENMRSRLALCIEKGINESTLDLTDGLSAGYSTIVDNNSVNEILDIISLWNEDENSDDLITTILSAISKAPNEGTEGNTTKSSLIDAQLKPFVDALIAKAEDYIKNNNDTVNSPLLQEQIRNLRTALTGVISSEGASSGSELSENFNALYTSLRRLEAVRIDKQIKDTYGFLNTIYQDKLIENATNADLADEDENVGLDVNAPANYSANGADQPTQRDQVRTQVEQDKIASAIQLGEEVYSLLKRNTIGCREEKIAEKLNSIDKSNVFYFLQGVYEHEKYGNIEGFFEKLDDDTKEKNVSKEMKLKLLNDVLEAAKSKEFNLKENYNCKELEKLVNKCTSTSEKAGKDFKNKLDHGWFLGWTKYSEEIDKYLKALYDEMKAIKEKQTQTKEVATEEEIPPTSASVQ